MDKTIKNDDQNLSSRPEAIPAILQILLESSNALIFSVDRDYAYTSFNQAHAAVMKALYGVDIRSGGSILEYMTVAEDREAAKVNLDRALAGEQVIESAFSGEDTRSRSFFEVTHNPIRSNDGAVMGVLVIAKDITEQKLAEEKIQELAKFPEENPNPIARIKRDGVLLYANPACAPLLKYWNAQVGQTLPEDQLRFIESIFDAGKIHETETAVGDQTYLILWVPVAGANYINAYGMIITERKRAENGITVEKELFRTTLASIGDAVITTDQEGVITFLNPVAEKLIGWSNTEAVGQPLGQVFSIVNEYTRQPAENPVNKALKTGTVIGLANHSALVTRDGRVIPIEDSAAPIMSAGQTLGVVMVFHDVTARRKTEEALRYQAALLDHLNVAVVAADEQYRLTAWNQAAEELYGWKAEEVLGKVGSDFTQTEYFDQDGPEILERISTIGHWRGEATQIKRDGTRFPVEVSSIVLHDQEGRISGYLSLNLDITERKQAEQTFSETKLLLQQVIDSSPSLIYLVDEQGRFLLANTGLAETFGESADQIRGKSREAFLPKEIAQQHQENDLKVMKSGKTIAFEEENQEQDGVHTYYSVKFPVTDSNGRIYATGGISTDITDRKRAEEALQESELKFRAMAETIPLAIYLTVGIEQKCEYLNPMFIKLFGYTLDIIPTVEQWWPLAYPDDEYRRQVAEEWTRKVERAIETQTPIEPMDVVVTCKDGSKKNILWGYITLGEKNYAYGLDLTDRKRAEEALKASELRFRLAAESLTDVIYEWDLKDRVDWYGDIDKMMGYPTGEFPRTLSGWAASLHPEDRELVLTAVNNQLKGIAPYNNVEYRISMKNGEWRWWSARGTVTRDERAEPYRWIGSITDITESKQTESTVRKMQTLLNETQEITKVGGWEYNVAAKHVIWTDEVYRIHGVSKEYDLGNPEGDIEFYAPEDQEKMDEAFRGAVEEGTPYDLELQLINAAQQKIWVRTTARTEKSDGKVVRVSGNIMDITERKQAEGALLQYSQRLAVINRLDRVISSGLDLSTVYDAFVTEMKELAEFDRTSIILVDEACKNWQIIRQWTQGEPAFQLLTWQPLEGSAFGWVAQHQQAFLEGILGEQNDWPEHEGLRKEGLQSRVLLPLILQGKVIGMLTLGSRQPKAYQQSDLELLQTLADQLAIAVQNATLYEQARLTAEDLELRVQARTAQLERANKDLESFSYSVSHDLRAPLRAINGFAQILTRRHRALLDKDGQHYLDNVVEASERMGVLIDDLLQYSRLGRASLHRQTVSLDDLFTQILGDLSTRISETQAVVELPPPGNMPRILSDPTLLGQIFTNIIDNALTYQRPEAPALIRVTYQVEADQHLFGVADNGIGIPAEYLEKIFNVFQRLHTIEEYPGTGIGLAVVKKSVELLGGRVWVESTEGSGSTFRIQIPKE